MYQNYTCLCSNGFQGPSCSIPIDPCQSNPCQNQGSCVRTSAMTYSCACPIDYEGSRCEKPINLCSNYSCLHGIAVRTSTFKCECQCEKSYYGKFCELNPCENNPCLIGECIPHENQTYSCQCPKGFQFIMGVYVFNRYVFFLFYLDNFSIVDVRILMNVEQCQTFVEMVAVV